MRLWTLHPGYLDARGLVAAWRESLLAQRVLEGRTRGYRHHPQLVRFRAATEPAVAIAAYLGALADEADARGYRFDRTRISRAGSPCAALEETEGQLRFEAGHLAAKLARRSPRDLPRLAADAVPRAHPLFRIVPGPVREWERASPSGATAPAPGRSRIVRP